VDATKEVVEETLRQVRERERGRVEGWSNVEQNLRIRNRDSQYGQLIKPVVTTDI
jgi:hypothetical protein